MTPIIVDIGSNHNQDYFRCLQIINEEASLGLWGVKLQLFYPKTLYHENSISDEKKAELEKQATPLEWVPKLSTYCRSKGIRLGITPFTMDVVDDCTPFVDFFKISSFDILRYRLMYKVHAMCNLRRIPFIFSTGMANYEEIENVIHIRKQDSFSSQTSMLHCISNYPAKVVESDLNIIHQLRLEFGEYCTVGWSDHSHNPDVIYTATTNGAGMIELHIDLEDKRGFESHHGHCWVPSEIKQLTEVIKASYSALPIWLECRTDKKQRDFRADPSDSYRPLLSNRRNVI